MAAQMYSTLAPEPMSAARPRPVVLIVEDERVSRRALAALLTACGYSTEAVGSGEEALHVLRGRHGTMPRIAVVDLDLPGMSGLDLIQHLERMDPSVQPILVTAAGGDRLGQMLRDRGVAYLRKPVDFDTLLSVISQSESRGGSALGGTLAGAPGGGRWRH